MPAPTYSSAYGGANWDNVLFQSCFFGGLVECRAWVAEFQNCQFSVNPDRTANVAPFAMVY